MACLVIAFGAVVVLPIALASVDLDGLSGLLMKIMRWPLLLFIVALALAAFYRFGPSRKAAECRRLNLGRRAGLDPVGRRICAVLLVC